MEEQTVNEVLDELQKDIVNTETIQDNKIHFLSDEVVYRVVMPTQKQNHEATCYKNKRYIKLLSEDGNLTIKVLTKILKEKQNIDIDDLDKQTKVLEEEMTQTYISLAMKKENETIAIQKLKTKLEEVRNKRLDIIMEMATFLSPAIENQVQDDYYRFLTAKCTEKLISKEEDKEDVWEKVWSSFKVYEDNDTKLPYLALGKLTELVYGC